MKKKENQETKKRVYNNEVLLTLFAFEYEEKKNCDIIKASLSGGKDSNGEYKKSTPVTVIITSETETKGFDFAENEFFDVKGSLVVEYNDYKGKTYTNLKIFADAVGNVVYK